jgi:hypothetical protein
MPLERDCSDILKPMQTDHAPVTSPNDSRLKGMGRDGVAAADQIAQMLAASPRERLRCLLEMLAFEERAHRAVLLSKVP